MPLALHSPSTLDTITTIVACMLQHAFLIWRVATPSPRLKFPVPFSSPVRGKDKYILLYDQRAENCTPSARTMLWFFFTTRLQLRSQYCMHTYKGLRIEPNLSFGIRNIFSRSCSYRIVGSYLYWKVIKYLRQPFESFFLKPPFLTIMPPACNPYKLNRPKTYILPLISPSQTLS